MASKAPKLREAHFEDYTQITALTVKFHLQTESYEAWTHLWADNPTYREAKSRLPMGWVLETANGKVVGFL